MDDAYVCSRCGYLVTFRNYDGNPHKPLHQPTGWPCWRMEQDGEGGEADSLPFPVIERTPEAEWRRVIDEGLELYRAYRGAAPMEPLVELVKRELAAGRVDVVRDLLVEILYRFGKSPERTSLFRQIVVSSRWQAMVERARRAASKAA